MQLTIDSKAICHVSASNRWQATTWTSDAIYADVYMHHQTWSYSNGKILYIHPLNNCAMGNFVFRPSWKKFIANRYHSHRSQLMIWYVKLYALSHAKWKANDDTMHFIVHMQRKHLDLNEMNKKYLYKCVCWMIMIFDVYDYSISYRWFSARL